MFKSIISLFKKYYKHIFKRKKIKDLKRFDHITIECTKTGQKYEGFVLSCKSNFLRFYDYNDKEYYIVNIFNLKDPYIAIFENKIIYHENGNI